MCAGVRVGVSLGVAVGVCVGVALGVSVAVWVGVSVAVWAFYWAVRRYDQDLITQRTLLLVASTVSLMIPIRVFIWLQQMEISEAFFIEMTGGMICVFAVAIFVHRAYAKLLLIVLATYPFAFWDPVLFYNIDPAVNLLLVVWGAEITMTLRARDPKPEGEAGRHDARA